MAKLTIAQKKRMPKSEFALPKTKGFPLNDKIHQEKAIQLAPRSYKAGNISKSTEQKIVAKAKAKLSKSSSKAKK